MPKTPKAQFLTKMGFCILWYHLDSNQGHKDFQSFALPTELWYLPLRSANVACFFIYRNFFVKKVLND